MSPATGSIRPATTRADFDAFAALVTEYVAWLRERYRDDPGFIDRVLGHQSFATELATLAQVYGPPHGRTLVAEVDGEIGGAVAFRRLDDGSCEMKRLFVAGRFTGRGLGRRLCEAIIAAARADGLTVMRLDTGQLLTEAIRMYRSMGLRECAPHRAYPAEVMRSLVFMELPLAGEAGRVSG